MNTYVRMGYPINSISDSKIIKVNVKIIIFLISVLTFILDSRNHRAIANSAHKKPLTIEANSDHLIILSVLLPLFSYVS